MTWVMALVSYYVAGTVPVEERVQAPHPIGVRAHRLKAERDTVVGERELHPALRRLPAEIAGRVDPHPVQHGEGPTALEHGPRLVREEVAHPEHHAQAEILRDRERAIAPFHQRPHLLDLLRQPDRVQEAIDHQPVKRIQRAQPEARIGAAQVLAHLPDDPGSGDDERGVNGSHERDGLVAVAGVDGAQALEREDPHGQVVEVLPVPVRLLADPDSPWPPEHPLDLGDHPLALAQQAIVSNLAPQGHQQHDAERVGPEIPQPVGPDARLPHPRQPGLDGRDLDFSSGFPAIVRHGHRAPDGTVPGCQPHVDAENAADLLDGVGIALRGMARLHDQLGFDRLDVRGGVLDHAIVSLLDRPVPLDGDDGVDRHGRRDGDRLQAQDEGVPRRHVVDRRRDEPDFRGAQISVDVGGHPREDKGQGQELPGEVGEGAPTCHVAPAMRGADEDDARHHGQWLEEESAAEQVAGLVAQLQLLQRPAADRVPELIPGADGLHLDQEPPLTVPDQDHLAQGWVLPLGVEPRNRRGQRLAQAERRQRDRVARVVLEEPELVTAAQLGFGGQAVVHLHPPDDARRRAVHEDDRDEPRPVRRGGDERRSLLQDPGEPAQEPERLQLHDRHAGDRERQRRRRLVLEGNLLAGDRDRLRVPGEVQLQRARERSALHERAPRVRDPEKGGHRHLQTWGHHVPAGSRGVDGPAGGGERSAEPRPAIPHLQAVDVELRDGDEPVQLTVPGAQRRRVECHLDPAERQREGAAARDNLRGVLRRERRGQRPVVQIRRDPNARVEPPRGSVPGILGEEEGVGVHGGAQIVVRLRGRMAVQQRQLGKRKEQVLVPLRCDHRPVQRSDGGLGMRVEGLEQTLLEEHIACRETRLARGDGAPAEVAGGRSWGRPGPRPPVPSKRPGPGTGRRAARTTSEASDSSRHPVAAVEGPGPSHTPNGYVSGMPGPAGAARARTALVSSNQTYSSNWTGSTAWK